MTISSSSLSSKTWKDFFLKSKNISYSNSLLKKIRQPTNPDCPFTDSINEISKNPGITFISLDASKEKLQLFHHVSILGGSRTDAKEILVGVLGASNDIVPIQIISNSIKEVKGKNFTFEQFADRLKSKDPLDHDRTAKSAFHNYNILPIPALLTQVFLNLEETDPLNVATKFFQAMYQFDTAEFENLDESLELDETHKSKRQDKTDNSNSSLSNENGVEDQLVNQETDKEERNIFAEEFFHILQFCQLCHVKQVPPVLYTPVDTSSLKNWLSSVQSFWVFFRPKLQKEAFQRIP